jgi:hypothetical protein
VCFDYTFLVSANDNLPALSHLKRDRRGRSSLTLFEIAYIMRCFHIYWGSKQRLARRFRNLSLKCGSVGKDTAVSDLSECPKNDHQHSKFLLV